MVSCLVSLWLAAAVGQTAPPEAAWLKSVPADAEVVVRFKALDMVGEDLNKMMEAMSAALAQNAGPALQQGLDAFRQRFGKPAAANPFLAVVRLPEGGAAGGPPPFAVIVKSDNYDGVLKSVAGKDDAKPKSEDGLDVVDTSDGQTMYLAKGAGFVAFGPSKELVGAIAKPKGGLDAKVKGDLATRFFAGDAGLYVNLAAIQKKFGDQIEQSRQQLEGAMEQAGAQAGPSATEAMKQMIDGGFKALKVADALTLSFDFSASGLDILGEATVLPGSDAAKSLAEADPGTAEMLGKLPGDAATFAYVKVKPGSFKGMQRLGMTFLFGETDKLSPEVKKAIELQQSTNSGEIYTATKTGVGGTQTISVSKPADPAKAVEAATALFQAMQKGAGFMKSAVLTPNAEKYRGISFHRNKATLDLEKLTPPNMPGGAESMKKMMGGDTVTSWYGTDGKLVLTVAAPDWNTAKTLIDSVLDGKGSLADAKGYDAIRSRQPKQVSFLVLLSAQGIVRQMASQLGMVMGGGEAPKIPSDMPKETALFGGSVTATPGGYQFQFTVPSGVGQVFEKGLMPMIQGLQGRVNQ